jgi:hypothetical protein
MTRLLWLSLGAGLLGTNLIASTIEFQATRLGQNSYRYTYAVSDFTFGLNQELDIRFDPTLYGTLSNGLAGSEFSVLLLQPNNPPGTFGDYSALAQVQNPSLAVPFSVDFTFLGSGTPGSQPFLINQFDANGNFVLTLASGDTTLQETTVPEPAGLLLTGGGLLMCAGLLFIRGRREYRPEKGDGVSDRCS